MNVRTLCLGILWFEDATGYEINKLAAEGRFSHFIEASYGSIYPALKRLAEEGLVTRREVVEPGKPARRVYTLTDAGREQLLGTLYEGASPDAFKSEFLFLCLYANALGGAYMARAVERQIALVEAGLTRLREALEKCEHEPSRFAIGYGVALHEAALAYLRANRRLIAAPAPEPARAAE